MKTKITILGMVVGVVLIALAVFFVRLNAPHADVLSPSFVTNQTVCTCRNPQPQITLVPTSPPPTPMPTLPPPSPATPTPSPRSTATVTPTAFPTGTSPSPIPHSNNPSVSPQALLWPQLFSVEPAFAQSGVEQQKVTVKGRVFVTTPCPGTNAENGIPYINVRVDILDRNGKVINTMRAITDWGGNYIASKVMAVRSTDKVIKTKVVFTPSALYGIDLHADWFQPNLGDPSIVYIYRNQQFLATQDDVANNEVWCTILKLLAKLSGK